MTPQKSRNPQPSPQGTQVVSRIAAILQAVASGSQPDPPRPSPTARG